MASGADVKTNPRTVFVRNLPYNLTDDQLEEAFSEVGPTKKCFIVKTKGSDGSERSKGFAFVQFALKEDAERAVKEKNGAKLLGRQLAVDLAKSRAPLEQRKTPLDQRKERANKSEASTSKPAQKLDKSAAEVPKHAGTLDPNYLLEKHKPNRQVVVGGVDGEEQGAGPVHRPERGVPLKVALVLARKAAPVECAQHPAPKDELMRGKVDADGCPAGPRLLVTYKTVKDARTAVSKLHGANQFKGKSLGASLWARQLGGEGSHVKKWRLIVRNLAYKVTEKDLRDAFSKAGFVWSISMPATPEGKPKGFAFVAMTCRADADKAIAKVNGTKIQDRPVAVDWALSKKEFENQSKPHDDHEQHSKYDGAMDLSDDEDQDTASESEGEEELDQQGGAGEEETREGVSEQESNMLARVLGSVLGEARETAGNSVQDELDKSIASQDSSGESEGEEAVPPPARDSKSAKAGGASQSKDERQQSSEVAGELDNRDARTVFVRGVPLEATQTMMRQKLETFGKIKSCRLVKDAVTGRLKGTAFVEYAAVEGAQKAVAAGQPGKKTEGVWLAASRLVLDMALTQDGARKLASHHETKKGLPADNRNLYLAKEGEIAEGSPAAEGLSKLDLQRRASCKREKELKLKSPNFFVSKERLSVHNIPLNMGEKALKKLFLDAVKRKATKEQPVIKQAKILYDPQKKNSDGTPRSKGIAFVQFTEHQHAIVALRELNNNPSIFHPDRRPIVEFAIEDVKKLALRERRQRLSASAAEKGIAPARGSGKRNRDDSTSGDAEVKNVDKPPGQRSKLEGERAGQPEHFKVGSKQRKRMREEGVSKASVSTARGDTHTPAPKQRRVGAVLPGKTSEKAARCLEGNASKDRARDRIAALHLAKGRGPATGPSRREAKSSRRKGAEEKLESLVASYRSKFDSGTYNGDKTLNKSSKAQVPMRDVRKRWFD